MAVVRLRPLLHIIMLLPTGGGKKEKKEKKKKKKKEKKEKKKRKKKKKKKKKMGRDKRGRHCATPTPGRRKPYLCVSVRDGMEQSLCQESALTLPCESGGGGGGGRTKGEATKPPSSSTEIEEKVCVAILSALSRSGGASTRKTPPGLCA